MAALGFEVHTDKENVTSASISRKGIKGISAQPFGSRDVNKLPGLPLRKALKNVNQQFPNAPSQGLGFAKNANLKNSFSVPSKSSLANRPGGIENMPMSGLMKKMDTKKTPSLVKKGIQDSAHVKRSSKAKSHKTKVKAEVEPIPHIDIPNEEEYDSDSIFPRSERLSSYVDKLLTWRPPCLFGVVPDSESDISDHEDDLILNDEICQMPVCLNEVPEFPSPEDLDEKPVDFPPLDFDEDDEKQKDLPLVTSPASFTDQSFTASFTLGPLQMTDSFHSMMKDEQADSSL